MGFTSEYVPLPLDQLRREAAVKKADGWRFIQTHAVNTDNGVDLYYSFMKEGHTVNYRVEGITPDDPVPSITDLFLAAFVFENEARELFGVDMRDIAIDFQGAMYAPAESTPMTFISPEQKAARDKARKAAAAKAAKVAAKTESGSDVKGDSAPAARRVFVMTPELQARLDAKLPTLSDDKRAKVEAALKARAKEAAAGQASGPAASSAAEEKAGDDAKAEKPVSQAAETQPRAGGEQQRIEEMRADEVLEQKIDMLDAKKAAIVRAALGEDAPFTDGGDSSEAAGRSCDAEVDRLLGLMDDAKAAKVIAALSKEGE